MAGIGFKIQKLLDKKTYLGAIQGYLLGAFVSSGPLIVIIFCIGMLCAWSSLKLNRDDIILFRVTLVYVYAISLIVTGFIQLNATRYIADLLFCDENQKILPCLLTLIVFSTFLNGAVGITFFYSTKIGAWYTFRAVALLILVSNIWITMVFITATKQYITISMAFIGGSILAIFCGDLLGKKCGIVGYLEGYAIGQALIFMILVAVVAREFPLTTKPIDFSFLAYFRKFPDLVMIGIMLNLGLWADKFVLWNSEYAETIHHSFRSYDIYDSCTFITYLSVIPTLTVFFIKVETSFYINFRKFYEIISGQGSLQDIENARKKLMQSLKDGMSFLIKIQIFVTLTCLVCASPIMKMFHLSPLQWGMFRISLVGSMLLVLLQIMVIMLLYFEFRKSALLVTIVYCLGNFIFTKITVQLDYSYLGYGFTVAALIALISGYILAEGNLKQLIYTTFTTQPIPQPAASK